MKINYFFPIFITLLLSTLMIGCEQKAEVLQSGPLDDVRIITRSCPNGGDCGCSITYKNPGSVGVTLCGTTDGDATACLEADPPYICEEIDGLIHSEVEMDIDYAKHFFCMETEHGLRIDVTTPGGPDTLIISCQEGILNPDTTMLIVHYPGGRFYIETTTECEVPPCL